MRTLLADRLIDLACDMDDSITRETILGRRKSRNVTAWRHIIAWVLYKKYNYTITLIGKQLGRDHSTIIHAISYLVLSHIALKSLPR